MRCMVASSAPAGAAAPRRAAAARSCSLSGAALRLSCLASPRSSGHASRRRAVVPRADVNADAFGAPGLSSSIRSPASARSAHVLEPSVRQFDFIVIGSGIAGLSYALKVAPYGTVAVITKAQAVEGCTRYAQGGVCAVLDPRDSVDKHVHDTMVAGAFLNDPK